jgi:predicted Fe-Mo cluster-binding NifX family protein
MGRGAIAALSRAGIYVRITEERSVSKVVEAAGQNKLRLISPQDACGGHQHGRGHGHGHSCGH